MLDGSESVFVHRIAVIKIAHDQRIDHPEFRKGLRQESKPLHRAQRHSGKVRAENFAQRCPGHLRVARPQFRMRQDVSDAAFRLAAQRSARTRGLAEQGKRDGPVGKRRRVQHFQQTLTLHAVLAVIRLQLGGARRMKEPLPQCQGNGGFLLQVPQQLPV